MRLLAPLFVALSTYSILPAPRVDWTPENTRRSICWLPAVGVFTALSLWAWRYLCGLLGAGDILFAAGAAALPALISGGIHLDGFADTTDALASHQPREKMLEILKDTHAGAFAIIACCLYFLGSFGLFSELRETRAFYAVCLGFILSRSLTALTVVTLPNARRAGMLAALTKSTARRGALAAVLIPLFLVCTGMILLSPLPGAIAVLCAGVWTLLYRRLALRRFGGVTGDTSGFFLQLCELFILLGGVLGALSEAALWS